MTHDEVIKRAIGRHAATVTGHRRDCRCVACCNARTKAKRYARMNGWIGFLGSIPAEESDEEFARQVEDLS